jgi:hypothetical protein
MKHRTRVPLPRPIEPMRPPAACRVLARVLWAVAALPLIVCGSVVRRLRCLFGGADTAQQQQQQRPDAPALVRARGLPCEEHYVRSRDGFFLCMHRIPHSSIAVWAPRTGRSSGAARERRRGAAAEGRVTVRSRPPRHRPASGARRSSSCTASCSRQSRSFQAPHRCPSGAPLPPPPPAAALTLGLSVCSQARRGRVRGACARASAAACWCTPLRRFDVWLGNARGNKYSCKHEALSPESEEYWNFSLDEPANIDVPTLIEVMRRHPYAAFLARSL